MSPSKTMIPCLDSEGLPGRISLKQARKYEKRGRGRFEANAFIFARTTASTLPPVLAPKLRHAPRLHVADSVMVDRFNGDDSGLNCIGLRWPLQPQGTPGRVCEA